MAKGFMEARTEIEGYLSKMEEIKKKVASIITEACETRIASGKTANIKTDIQNILEGFSKEDREDILIEVISLMMRRKGLPSNNKQRSDRDISAIFSNR